MKLAIVILLSVSASVWGQQATGTGALGKGITWVCWTTGTGQQCPITNETANSPQAQPPASPETTHTCLDKNGNPFQCPTPHCYKLDFGIVEIPCEGKEQGDVICDSGNNCFNPPTGDGRTNAQVLADMQKRLGEKPIDCSKLPASDERCIPADDWPEGCTHCYQPQKKPPQDLSAWAYFKGTRSFIVETKDSTMVKLSDAEYAHLEDLRQRVADEERRLALKYGAQDHPFMGAIYYTDRYEFHGQFLLIERSKP
jgi:hypothetical protein